jgi:hypothetical protein
MEPVKNYEPPLKSVGQIISKRGPNILAARREEKKRRKNL